MYAASPYIIVTTKRTNKFSMITVRLSTLICEIYKSYLPSTAPFKNSLKIRYWCFCSCSCGIRNGCCSGCGCGCGCGWGCGCGCGCGR